MPAPSDDRKNRTAARPGEKAVKTRCPHCQSVNDVVGAVDNAVFQCVHCEKQFRLRRKADKPAPAPVVVTDVKRFPIRCKCQAKMLVTYSDFGKRVKCSACQQMIKIPDWVTESKFTEEEFDDMFSPEEREAFQQMMAQGRMNSR